MMIEYEVLCKLCLIARIYSWQQRSSAKIDQDFYLHIKVYYMTCLGSMYHYGIAVQLSLEESAYLQRKYARFGDLY
jgi:hypothetical protein